METGFFLYLFILYEKKSTICYDRLYTGCLLLKSQIFNRIAVRTVPANRFFLLYRTKKMSNR